MTKNIASTSIIPSHRHWSSQTWFGHFNSLTFHYSYWSQQN